MPKYKIGEKVYNVEESSVEAFLKKAEELNVVPELVQEEAKTEPQQPGATVADAPAPDTASVLEDGSSEPPKIKDKLLQSYYEDLNSIYKEADSLKETWLAESEELEKIQFEAVSAGFGGTMLAPTEPKDPKYAQHIDQAKKDLQARYGKNADQITEDQVINEAKNIYATKSRAAYIKDQQENILRDLKKEYGVNAFDTLSHFYNQVHGFTNIDSDYNQYQKARDVLTATFTQDQIEANKEAEKLNQDYNTKFLDFESTTRELKRIQQDYDFNPNLVTIEDAKRYQELSTQRKDIFAELEDLDEQITSKVGQAGDAAEAADMSYRNYLTLDNMAGKFTAALSDLVGGVAQVKQELKPLEVVKRIAGEDNFKSYVETLPDGIQKAIETYELNNQTFGKVAEGMFNTSEKLRNTLKHNKSLGEINSFDDFLDFMVDLVSEQAVNTAAISAMPAVGLGLVSASSGGQKMYELKKIEGITGETYSPLEYYGSAMLYTGGEFVSEKIFQTKVAKGAKKFNDAVKKAAKGLEREPMRIEKLVDLAKDIEEGGASEVIAQISNNFADKYVLGNQEVGLFDGVDEAYLTGKIMTGTFMAPGIAAEALKVFTTSKEKEELRVNYENILEAKNIIDDLDKDLIDLANQNLSPSELKRRTKSIEDQRKIQADILERNVEEIFMKRKVHENRINDLTSTDKKIIADSTGEITKLLNLEKQLRDNIGKYAPERFDQIIEKINVGINYHSKIIDDRLSRATIMEDLKRINQREVLEGIYATTKAVADGNIDPNDLKDLKVFSYDSKEGVDAILNAFAEATDYVTNNMPDGPAKDKILETLFINSTLTQKQGDASFDGFAYGQKDGIPFMFVDLNERQLGTTISHEYDHLSILAALKLDPSNDLIELAELAVDHLADNYNFEYEGRDTREYFEALEDNYYRIYGPSVKGKMLDKLVAEEKLAKIGEFLRAIDINKDKKLQAKLIDGWNKFSKNDPNKFTSLKTGKDVFNMFTQFHNAFERGQSSDIIQKILNKKVDILQAPVPGIKPLDFSNLNFSISRLTPEQRSEKLQDLIKDQQALNDDYQAGYYPEDEYKEDLDKIKKQIKAINEFNKAAESVEEQETIQETEQKPKKRTKITESQKKLNERVDKLVGEKDADGNYIIDFKGEFKNSKQFADVYEKLINGNLINPLITRGIEGNVVRGKPIEQFIEDVKMELTGHISNFDPSKNNSLMGWINSQLSNKKGNVLNRYKKDFGEGKVSIDVQAGDVGSIRELAAEDNLEDFELTTEQETDTTMNLIDLRKLINYPAKLSMDDQVVKDLKMEAYVDEYNKFKLDEKLEDLDLASMYLGNTPRLYDYYVAVAMGISPKKILLPQPELGRTRTKQGTAVTLTPLEAENGQRFIFENAQAIIDVLPEGYTDGITGVAQDIYLNRGMNIPKNILRAFYEKGERISFGAGLTPYKLRKNITKAEFLEAFGMLPDGTPMSSFNERTPEAQSIKALATLISKLASNTEIRQMAEVKNDAAILLNLLQGKSPLMLSKKLDERKKVREKKKKERSQIEDRFSSMIAALDKRITSGEELSREAAKQLSLRRERKRFLMDPSADDFEGLMYAFYASGKLGEEQQQFIKEKLLDPYEQGLFLLDDAKLRILNNYKNQKKIHAEANAMLNENTGYKDFTYDQALRIYLYNKSGHDIPGLNEQDIKTLVRIVKDDKKLRRFALGVKGITTQKLWLKPGKDWLDSTLKLDVIEITDTLVRKTFLQEFLENQAQFFTPNNMNKILAALGPAYHSALKDAVFKMQTGKAIPEKPTETSIFWNWFRGAVSGTMFFNSRSASLQLLSTANFINYKENNIFAAAKAFANLPQFWKDFKTIYNSPYLVSRRGGLRTEIDFAEFKEIFDKKRGNIFRRAIGRLLDEGFLLTKAGDSTAISWGGALLYRNKINSYLKQGDTKEEAERKAMLDVQRVSESTQQSARLDKLSQQQTTRSIGRVFLAFQNTSMQYNRIIIKAVKDLAARRGDPKEHIGKIVYYLGFQNALFSALQSGMQYVLLGGEFEEEEIEQKWIRTANGTLDSFIRGYGWWGVTLAAAKNTLIETYLQYSKDNPTRIAEIDILVEAAQVAPPIGIKARQIGQALKTAKWNKDEFFGENKFDDLDTFLEDPGVYTSVLAGSAITNVPAHRLFYKIKNINDALNADTEFLIKLGMIAGWSSWEVGVESTAETKQRIKLNNQKAKTTKKRRTITFD